jgi:hypothetical protein
LIVIPLRVYAITGTNERGDDQGETDWVEDLDWILKTWIGLGVSYTRRKKSTWSPWVNLTKFPSIQNNRSHAVGTEEAPAIIIR